VSDLSTFSVAVRIALATAAPTIGWWVMGPSGLVFAAPVMALLLARTILTLASGAKRTAKALAIRSVEGDFYAFRNIPVSVWQDEREQRWLAVASVRAVLTSFPREEVIGRLFPSGVVVVPRGFGPAVRADELIAFLAKSQQADAAKFRNWVQREVYLPSGSARRAGAAPTAPV
jgi:hypothetical protein